MSMAQAASAAAKAAAAPNTGSVPSSTAAPPITGPKKIPTIAAPMAPPISCPRRSRGAAPTSHARLAAHEQAPPTPWKKRATSRTTTFSATPKMTLVTARRPSPVSSARLTPKRTASQPPGSAPARVPAAYEADSTPAAVFDRSRSSA